MSHGTKGETMALTTRSVLAAFGATAMLVTSAAAVCGDPFERSQTGAAGQPALAPSSETLLALERKAAEAYVKGDGAFFERILSDKLVMQAGGSRLTKTDVVKMVSGVRCEVNDGWTLTEPQLSMIHKDTYALSYKSTMEGECTVDGKTETLPGPVRASSIWVGSGENWQVVFHGEIPIIDPAAPPTTPEGHDSQITNKLPANPIAAEARPKPASAPVSDALMAAERSIWDAWMKHDVEKINELTAREITFVNLFGTYFPDKTTTVADWTSEACDINSFMLSNGVGSFISPAVGILTLTGTVRGTCGGTDIGGQKIHATTVYVKDGDTWKWAFGFNSPN